MIRLFKVVAALIVGLILAVVASGLVTPREHEATRRVVLQSPPSEVWSYVAEVQRYPDWRRGVQRIDWKAGGTSSRAESEQHSGAVRVGDRFVEYGAEGAILFEVEVVEPERRLVTRIADESLPFGGRWTMEVEPQAGGGSALRITENGFVSNFLFRALSPLFSKTATMEAWLGDLLVALGEDAEIEA